MTGNFLSLRVDVGEPKPILVKIAEDGRIEMQHAGRAGVVRTDVSRVFYSALRTRALNIVRDRERAARRRLARKAVAR